MYPRGKPSSRYGPSGPEVKSTDLSAIGMDFDSAAAGGQVLCLNNNKEGAGFFNRIGRRIRMLSLHVQGLINRDDNAQSDTFVTMLRCLIIYDRQPNGALPALSDMIQTTDLNGNNTTTVLSSVNMSNKDRFAILSDWRMAVPPIGASGVTPSNTTVTVQTNQPENGFVYNKFLKLRGLETHYGASTGAIGDIKTGSLLFVCFSSTANADGPWTIQIDARLRYMD